MKIKYPFRNVSALLIVTSFGCGHTQVDERVDAKLTNEPEVASEEELNRKNEEAITSASHLSEAQKEKLLKVHRDVGTQVQEIEDEEKRLQAVLVKELVSTGYNADDLNTLKKRLKKLEKKKMDLQMSAIDDVNWIMNRTRPIPPRIAGDFEGTSDRWSTF